VDRGLIESTEDRAQHIRVWPVSSIALISRLIMAEDSSSSSPASSSVSQSNTVSPHWSQLGEVPLYIDKLIITGNNRTKQQFIKEELSAALQNSTTVKQVNENLLSSLSNLHSYEIFNNASYRLDLSDRFEHCNVNLIVEEKQPFSLGTKVTQDFHTGEQIVEAKATVKNVFGEAERVDLAASYGNLQSNSFNLTFTKPKLFKYQNKSYQGAFNLFSQMQHYTQFASFSEKQRGFHSILTDSTGNHQINYEYSYRDIFPASRKLNEEEKVANNYTGPSSYVLQNAQTSVKSSIKYQFTHSTLNNLFVPTKGKYW
jgi:hypothetical protein